MYYKQRQDLPVAPEHSSPLFSAHAAQSSLKLTSDFSRLPGVVICTTGLIGDGLGRTTISTCRADHMHARCEHHGTHGGQSPARSWGERKKLARLKWKPKR